MNSTLCLVRRRKFFGCTKACLGPDCCTKQAQLTLLVAAVAFFSMSLVCRLSNSMHASPIDKEKPRLDSKLMFVKTGPSNYDGRGPF